MTENREGKEYESGERKKKKEVRERRRKGRKTGGIVGGSMEAE